MRSQTRTWPGRYLPWSRSPSRSTKTPPAWSPTAQCRVVTPRRCRRDPVLGPAGDRPVHCHQYRRHHRPVAVFRRRAGPRGTNARLLAGQYLGFAGILGVAVLVSLGAGVFLSPQAIPYFGLIPLGLGLWAAWQAWRGDDDDDDAKVEGKNVAVWSVAGVTFANGGDNI